MKLSRPFHPTYLLCFVAHSPSTDCFKPGSLHSCFGAKATKDAGDDDDDDHLHNGRARLKLACIGITTRVSDAQVVVRFESKNCIVCDGVRLYHFALVGAWARGREGALFCHGYCDDARFVH